MVDKRILMMFQSLMQICFGKYEYKVHFHFESMKWCFAFQQVVPIHRTMRAFDANTYIETQMQSLDSGWHHWRSVESWTSALICSWGLTKQVSGSSYGLPRQTEWGSCSSGGWDSGGWECLETDMSANQGSLTQPLCYQRVEHCIDILTSGRFSSFSEENNKITHKIW